MRRYIAYASAFVLLITLLVWGISRFVQPILPASINADFVLFVVVLLSVTTFLGGFNETIELFHKIFGRKTSATPQKDQPPSNVDHTASQESSNSQQTVSKPSQTQIPTQAKRSPFFSSVGN